MIDKRLKTALAAVAGFLLAALILAPLLIGGLSPVTKGAMVGVAGVICLAAIALGGWNAVHGERRRRAKEDIWINH